MIGTIENYSNAAEAQQLAARIIAKPSVLDSRPAPTPMTVADFCEHFPSLASLSTSSLNHFTETIARAQALCTGIACIYESLPSSSLSTIDAKSSPARKRRTKQVSRVIKMTTT